MYGIARLDLVKNTRRYWSEYLQFIVMKWGSYIQMCGMPHQIARRPTGQCHVLFLRPATVQTLQMRRSISMVLGTSS